MIVPSAPLAPENDERLFEDGLIYKSQRFLGRRWPCRGLKKPRWRYVRPKWPHAGFASRIVRACRLSIILELEVGELEPNAWDVKGVDVPGDRPCGWFVGCCAVRGNNCPWFVHGQKITGMNCSEARQPFVQQASRSVARKYIAQWSNSGSPLEPATLLK